MTAVGYDPTLSVSQQLAKSKERLASYLANGREGTPVVEAVRQQIADLKRQAERDKVRNHNPPVGEVNAIAAPRQQATAASIEAARLAAEAQAAEEAQPLVDPVSP